MASGCLEAQFCGRFAADCERMEVFCMLAATIKSAVGCSLGKIMYVVTSRWSVATRVLAATIALAILFVIVCRLPESALYTSVFSTVSASHTSRYRMYFSAILATATVGNSMALFFAGILQNLFVRMDVRRAAVCAIGFAMVWLLKAILHNYVIRMVFCHVIGYATGCALAELVSTMIERHYHARQIHESLQLVQGCSPCLANFQESILGLSHEHIDPHQLLELRALCVEFHVHCHQLHTLCQQLHALLQSYEPFNCTNLCTNLGSRLGSRAYEVDVVANAFGGNGDGQPGLQVEAAAVKLSMQWNTTVGSLAIQVPVKISEFIAVEMKVHGFQLSVEYLVTFDRR